MKYVIAWLCSLFVVGLLKAQENLHNLENKLFAADSVIIVSHDDTSMFTVDKATGKRLSPPKLVLNGKPNQKIIHEKQSLSDTAVLRLSKIVSRPFQDSVIETGRCFMPHHSIFIFQKGKVSFVNICFGCRSVETSKNIRLDESDFDNQKWNELYDFFIQKGMRYGL